MNTICNELTIYEKSPINGRSTQNIGNEKNKQAVPNKTWWYSVYNAGARGHSSIFHAQMYHRIEYRRIYHRTIKIKQVQN